MKHPPLSATIIATGFGSGFWPWGPGTAGALLAVIIWLGCKLIFPAMTLFIVTLSLCVVFMLLGVWAIKEIQPYWGDDPKRVVVDEMVGMWIPLLVVSPLDNCGYPIASFILFRFFDIVKPLGIRWLDRRTGAFWVMADDILAGVYSLIIISFFRWII